MRKIYNFIMGDKGTQGYRSFRDFANVIQLHLYLIGQGFVLKDEDSREYLNTTGDKWAKIVDSEILDDAYTNKFWWDSNKMDRKDVPTLEDIKKRVEEGQHYSKWLYCHEMIDIISDLTQCVKRQTEEFNEVQNDCDTILLENERLSKKIDILHEELTNLKTPKLVGGGEV